MSNPSVRHRLHDYDHQQQYYIEQIVATLNSDSTPDQSLVSLQATPSPLTTLDVVQPQLVFHKFPDDLIMQLLSVEQRITTPSTTAANGSGASNELDNVNPLTSNLVLLGIISLALVCLILLTVLGNLFVIYAIQAERNLKTVGNYLVFSLAVTDLLVACLVMPIGAVYEITLQWRMGTRLCELWTFIDVLCCTASIYHLLAIACDRYMAVTSVDYIHRRKGKHVCCGIALIWLLSAIVSLGPILGWKDEEFERRILKHGVCLVSQSASYQVFATIFSFYAPSFLLLLLYYRIYQVAKTRIKLKKQRKSRGRRKASFYRSTPGGALAGGVDLNNGNNCMGVTAGAVLEASNTNDSCGRKDSLKELASSALSIHRSSFNPSSSDYFVGVHSSSTFYSSSTTTTTTTTDGTTATNVTLNSSDADKVLPNLLSPLAIVMPEAINLPNASGSSTTCGNNHDHNAEKSLEVKRLSVQQFLAFQQQKQGNLCDRYVRKASQSTTTVRAIVEEEETTTSSSSTAAVITVTVPTTAHVHSIETNNDRRASPTIESIQSFPPDKSKLEQVSLKESLDTTEGYEEEEADEDEEDDEEEEEEEEEECFNEEDKTGQDYKDSNEIECEKESSSTSNKNPSELKLKVLETHEVPIRKASVRVKASDAESSKAFTTTSFVQRKFSFQRNRHFDSCTRSMTPNSEEDESGRHYSSSPPLHHHHNHVSSIGCSSPTGPTTASGASDFKNQTRTKRLKFRNKITRYGSSSRESRQESKAAKTLTIITGIFIMCWLPFFVLALVMPLCTDCIINKYLFDFCLWLGWANSSVNPVLYTIFSPDFRNAFKRLIYGRKHHRRRQQAKKNGIK